MDLPRLTTFLRCLEESNTKNNFNEKYNSRILLERRQEKNIKKQSNWKCITDVIKNFCSNSDKILKNYMKLVYNIAGETEDYHPAAAFLFVTLKNNKNVVNSTILSKLRSSFGTFSEEDVKNLNLIVHQIISDIPVDVCDSMLLDIENGIKDNYFGDEIDYISLPEPNEYYNTDRIKAFIYQTSDIKRSSDFNSFLPDTYEENIVNESSYITQPPNSNSVKDEKNIVLKNANSLKARIKNEFSQNSETIYIAIIDILSSPHSNDEIQDELFQLLGFDRISLIEEILKNRSNINLSLIKQIKNSSGKYDKPMYGPQVIVQSDTEKENIKRLRKDEKKQRKKYGENEEDPNNFDILQMRLEREKQLLNSRKKPLFKAHPSSNAEKYPFVFDNLAEAKKMAALVSGNKMSLPVGTERRDTEAYEEVNIPPSDPPPTKIGENLVKISDMDKIGQIAFDGMKTLNRIQSVVYDTAYGTNENLLICAPTGAGKTNIAMLTILNTIKQHIENGVVKTDQFKIIYVAPMKALAAEMTRTFSRRLEKLNVQVRELTGDMQLTKSEIMTTQMLVTTPEKWDVVTRKSTGDVALTQIVKLLIFDEVHLLHDERGAVIESLVARTLRQVESSQMVIRIVGLSATLPNYIDVARFLNVNPYKGLFFFDGRFRPVPLGMTFIGVKGLNKHVQMERMNEACFEKVLYQVRKGEQVMVFVHARNETVRTATLLAEKARNSGNAEYFLAEDSPRLAEAVKQIGKSRNKPLKQLFSDGFCIHHAGMLRHDRNLVEKYFEAGFCKVLVCTATLAWGVNLPAHAVIIKGTQIYDAKRGSFVDLGLLDVMQIFGRAGRPQYDTFGHGTILTNHEKLAHYLSLLTRQNAIESQFIAGLADNLNAEICLGSITNVDEACNWLRYTYLFVRMKMNPFEYGIDYRECADDPNLSLKRKKLIVDSARNLDKAKMIRFDERTGYLHATDLGRTASHYYIKYPTIQTINEELTSQMTEDKVFSMVSKSQEFEQIKVRDDELVELDFILENHCCLPALGGTENGYGKVNILLQAFISRVNLDSFSLVSDQGYVSQNSSRIFRALFEIVIKKGMALMTGRLLKICKFIERRLWPSQHVLNQFAGVLSPEILRKLDNPIMARKNKSLSNPFEIEKLREMDSKEIGLLINHPKMGIAVKTCVHQIPRLEFDVVIQPITRTVLRVRLDIRSNFTWSDRFHGNGPEPFWIWIEDPTTDHIYYVENFLLQKKQAKMRENFNLVFTIPIFQDPLPSQYLLRCVSDRWLGSDLSQPISFKHLILPEQHLPNTELLDLQPLSKSSLKDENFESLYKFDHFNPIQTQVFHPVYHSDVNILLGAPTGSGKTIVAELAMFRVFRLYPKSTCVYIAPLKALVRERVDDWKIRFEQKLGKRVVELTGDVAPDMKCVQEADVIVTTPEKWDGISRSWQTRSYVKSVRLLVIDEIHLLGDDRGPVLEVIVSRTNFISSHTDFKVRVVGLSTALANAKDLADWLGIKTMGLFNFRPSVRPVPLEVHIHGFAGKHYCPRMATMNKPAFQGIKQHSPEKPTLIFVSSRRQTRLTALDLISYLAADDNPKQWMKLPENEMENIISGVKEPTLKLTLSFGIGMHHAGLVERDRKTVEELFVNMKIQVLIATSTLAWGVNFPAHLVIVKGTEYFDGKTKRYIDFPITDVLQMMGRAGRPQFDDQGKALIFVHDQKKHFYKKFLYEPFPVESNLLAVLPEHISAEVVAGTITTKQAAMDYITWTYFFRRLLVNPSYYELEDTDHGSLNTYLSTLVEKCVQELADCYCLEIGENSLNLDATDLGRIGSYYYLHHTTMKLFNDKLRADCDLHDILETLSNSKEYAELPVRHNEDHLNSELAKDLPISLPTHAMDSSHIKAHILLQAYFSHVPLPSSDYATDTKSVLDQAIRILQAMIDVAAGQGWLVTSIRIINLLQMIVQKRWITDSSLLTLPHINSSLLARFQTKNNEVITLLPQLINQVEKNKHFLHDILSNDLAKPALDNLLSVIMSLPVIDIEMSIKCEKSLEISMKNIWESGPNVSSEKWIDVACDTEYFLNITIKNVCKKRRDRAHAPNFPKPKDEGWIVIIGDPENQELIALKRITSMRGNKTRTSLSFFTPEKEGRAIFIVYLLSDCYLGLDQQYEMHFIVGEKNDKYDSNDEEI